MRNLDYLTELVSKTMNAHLSMYYRQGRGEWVIKIGFPPQPKFINRDINTAIDDAVKYLQLNTTSKTKVTYNLNNQTK